MSLVPTRVLQINCYNQGNPALIRSISSRIRSTSKWELDGHGSHYNSVNVMMLPVDGEENIDPQ